MAKRVLITGRPDRLGRFLAPEVLGYEPQAPFDRGLDELAGWLGTPIGSAQATDARAELHQRRPTV